MSTPRSSTPRDSFVVDGSSSTTSLATPLQGDAAPPTYAPPTYAHFSPTNLSTATIATTSAAKRRSTILVHQKSPLLLATPPQITRALAYSHPFLLPLNKIAGLLSWTTDDPWESFLLVVLFWAVAQYGDVVLRFATPIVTVAVLIAGMYGRRFSPLSSSGWTESSDGRKGAVNGGGAGGSGGGHQRAPSENTSTRHQKTLDEIVDTLKVFTTRCNILMEPLLEMTDFLSTQRTATSATTRPALTTLFVRILAVTPIWIALTLPPLRIITTKRVILVFGTLLLTWHSKACRISRTLLWRSAVIRRVARGVTGLPFEIPVRTKAGVGASNGHPAAEASSSSSSADPNKKAEVKRPASALTAALKRSRPGGPQKGSAAAAAAASAVRFTFILYENQRRWVGLGWTNSLFAYERAAWTDEQNNPMPSKDDFELPEVEDAAARWRWVGGSRWRVDGAPEMDEEVGYDTDAARNGWVYYDNKWQNGRRGQDSWNRWTRRRKWYRDAELVEVSPDEQDPEQDQDQEQTPVASPEPPPALPPRTPAVASRDSQALLSTSNPEPSAATTAHLSSSNPESSSSVTAAEPGDEAYASAAVLGTSLSTSSKSAASRFKWPAPTLRRRTTGGSGTNNHGRSRRTSEASSAAASSSSNTNAAASHPAVTEDDDEGFFGSLTPALELEIQGHRKGQDAWGIGDEAQMGLE